MSGIELSLSTWVGRWPALYSAPGRWVEGVGFIRYQEGCSLSHRSQFSSHVRTWSLGGHAQVAKSNMSALDASVPSPSVQTLRSSHIHLTNVLKDLCWEIWVQWIEGQVGLVRGDAGPMIRGSGWLQLMESSIHSVCHIT